MHDSRQCHNRIVPTYPSHFPNPTGMVLEAIHAMICEAIHAIVSLCFVVDNVILPIACSIEGVGIEQQYLRQTI